MAVGKCCDRTALPVLDHDPEVAEPGAQGGEVRRLVRAVVGRVELALEDRAQGHRVAHGRLDQEVTGIVRGLVAHRTHVLISGNRLPGSYFE
jgi:hypothetical protein